MADAGVQIPEARFQIPDWERIQERIPLASGLWPLASGLWPLASGLWPLASGIPECRLLPRPAEHAVHQAFPRGFLLLQARALHGGIDLRGGVRPGDLGRVVGGDGR